MRFIRKLIEANRRARAKRSLALTDEGVAYEWSDSRCAEGFAWDAVEEIRTFKVDLYIYDNIRLAFLVGERWHEIHEEEDGFRDVADEMQRRFPSIPEDWYFTVMLLAFESNERTLWIQA